MTGPSPRTSGAAGGGPEREGPGAGTPAAPPSALAGPPRGLESFDARGPPAVLDGDGVRRVFALSCGERGAAGLVRMAAAAGAAWVWGFLSGKVPTALDLMKGMLEQGATRAGGTTFGATTAR